MKKNIEKLLGVFGLIFLVTLIVSLILSFGFETFYKPLAQYFSSIIKYSFIITIILAVISSLTDKEKPSNKDKNNNNTTRESDDKKISLESAVFAETDKNDRKSGLFHNGVHCPKCNSLNIDFMQNNRKGFSVGKATSGALLTGGIGTLAGFVGKKGKSNQWFCRNCGNTFKSKK